MRITKCMRYQIIKPIDITWEECGNLLRDIQYDTRQILNKTVQLCWEWQGFTSRYKDKIGEYPSKKDVLGYTNLQGYCYSRLKEQYYRLYSGNLSQSIKRGADKWNSDLKEILKGEKSIPSYKRDLPIDVVDFPIYKDGKEYYSNIKLLGSKYTKEIGRSSSSMVILLDSGEKSKATILDRIISGEYKSGASQILHSKNKWFLNVTYSFEQEEKCLDTEKILGVDMGIVYPVYMSVGGTFFRYKIKGGEIEKHRNEVEKLKLSLLDQAKYCGDGRHGHGRGTRNKPANNIGDTISNFRNTINHKYSKFVVEIAEKNGCGVIQMENLEGITDHERENKFLKNWTYYDLQQKIEYKAKEKGIKVIYINPKYTSQRCSKCGHIDRENRLGQSTFKCTKCGFETNADYNASLNIATKDIEKIIAKEIRGANNEL